MSTTSTYMAILIGTMALSTAACVGPSAVESNYGDAVRSNLEAQVYDPTTLTNPSSDLVEGTDGQRMEGVMESHRGQQGNANNVARPLVIDVGGN